jgi:hypothetical protein
MLKEKKRKKDIEAALKMEQDGDVDGLMRGKERSTSSILAPRFRRERVLEQVDRRIRQENEDIEAAKERIRAATTTQAKMERLETLKALLLKAVDAIHHVPSYFFTDEQAAELRERKLGMEAEIYNIDVRLLEMRHMLDREQQAEVGNTMNDMLSHVESSAAERRLAQLYDELPKIHQQDKALEIQFEKANDVDKPAIGQQMQQLVDRRVALNRELEQIEQHGQGRRRPNAEDGLDTNQINHLMRGYRDYLGCIGRDQVSTLRIRPGTRFGFVMNTDPSTKPGSHWVAIFVDNRPQGSNSIEYFNSLADQPTRPILEELRRIVGMLRPQARMKFKVNKIADQMFNSSNCGYFAAKFLIDRFNGVPFAEASGYNSRAPAGEARIEEWKASLGVKPFGHLGYSEEEDGQKGEGCT